MLFLREQQRLPQVSTFQGLPFSCTHTDIYGHMCTHSPHPTVSQPEAHREADLSSLPQLLSRGWGTKTESVLPGRRGWEQGQAFWEAVRRGSRQVVALRKMHSFNP